MSRQCRTNKSRSRIDDVTNASRRAIAGDSSRLRVHGARAIIHDQHRSITSLCQRRLKHANHARRDVCIIRRHLWTLHLQAAIGKTSSLGPKPTIGATSAKCPPGPTGSPFLNGLNTDSDAVWLDVYLDFGGCLSESGPVSLSSCFDLPYLALDLPAVLIDSDERAVLRRLRPGLPPLLRLPIFSSIYTQRLQSRLCMLVPTSPCLVPHGGLSNHVWTVRTTDVV